MNTFRTFSLGALLALVVSGIAAGQEPAPSSGAPAPRPRPGAQAAPRDTAQVGAPRPARRARPAERAERARRVQAVERVRAVQRARVAQRTRVVQRARVAQRARAAQRARVAQRAPQAARRPAGERDLFRGITLSEAQRAQLKTVRERYRTQAAGLRRTTMDRGQRAARPDSAGRAAVRSRIRATREQAATLRRQEVTELRGILSPDQRRAFDANRERLAGRAGAVRARRAGTGRPGRPARPPRPARAGVGGRDAAPGRAAPDDGAAARGTPPR